MRVARTATLGALRALLAPRRGAAAAGLVRTAADALPHGCGANQTARGRTDEALGDGVGGGCGAQCGRDTGARKASGRDGSTAQTPRLGLPRAHPRPPIARAPLAPIPHRLGRGSRQPEPRTGRARAQRPRKKPRRGKDRAARLRVRGGAGARAGRRPAARRRRLAGGRGRRTGRAGCGAAWQARAACGTQHSSEGSVSAGATCVPRSLE